MGGRLASVLRRLERLLRRSEAERDVEEELRFHLEMGRALHGRRGRASRRRAVRPGSGSGNPLAPP